MSKFIDTCDEQNIGVETLFNLLVHVDSSNNLYLNICDSGIPPDDLIPAQCDNYLGWQSLFRNIISFDENGDPCLRITHTGDESTYHFVVDYLGNYVLDYLGNYIIV